MLQVVDGPGGDGVTVGVTVTVIVFVGRGGQRSVGAGAARVPTSCRARTAKNFLLKRLDILWDI